MPSYQPKFDKGDEIYLDGRYTVILDLEDGEYYLSKRGRLKWIDASEIDAIAKKRERSNE